MKEIFKANVWDYVGRGSRIIIPTNGSVKGNGCCVMGRGLASQCKTKYPTMPLLLGRLINAGGNHVYDFIDPVRVITFPVKHIWWENADIELIERSCQELIALIGKKDINVWLPRVGCGNGNLKWQDVKPVLSKYFTDDRFTIVNRGYNNDTE